MLIFTAELWMLTWFWTWVLATHHCGQGKHYQPHQHYHHYHSLDWFKRYSIKFTCFYVTQLVGWVNTIIIINIWNVVEFIVFCNYCIPYIVYVLSHQTRCSLSLALYSMFWLLFSPPRKKRNTAQQCSNADAANIDS